MPNQQINEMEAETPSHPTQPDNAEQGPQARPPPTTRVFIPLPPSPPPPHPRLVLRSVGGFATTVVMLLVAWFGILFTALEPEGALTARDVTSGEMVTPRIQFLRSSSPWWMAEGTASSWWTAEGIYSTDTDSVTTILGHKPLVDPRKPGIVWANSNARDEQLITHYCVVEGTNTKIPQEDCHRAFPSGFDITVAVGGSVLALTRASISSELSFVAADLPISFINSTNAPRRVDATSFKVSNMASSKTCRNAIDECIIASVQQTSYSYDMVPEMQGHRRSRLLFTLSGVSPLEMHRLLVDDSSLTETFSITVLLGSAKISTTTSYRFVLLLLLLALVPLSLVAIKLLGKIVAARHPTFRPSIIPPSHQDVVDEAWEELIITGQHLRAYAEDSFSWLRGVGWRLPALLWFRVSTMCKQAVRVLFCCRPEEPLLAGEGSGRSDRGDSKGFQRMSTTTVEMGSKEEEAALSNSDDEGDICRICRVGDPVEDLISPCACSGSSKFIHRECLNRWRTLTTNPDHQRVCAECKTEYSTDFITNPDGDELSTIQRAVRSVMTKVRALLNVVVGVVVCIACIFLFGYVILGLTALLAFDPNVRFDVWGEAFSLGGCNAATLLVIYVRGLPFVTDFPSSLGQRIPAVYVASVLSPLILGYAARVASALIFRCILTPTVSFGMGASLFYIGGSFVGSLAMWTMELCGEQVAGANQRNAPFDGEEEEGTAVEEEPDDVPQVDGELAEEEEPAPAEEPDTRPTVEDTPIAPPTMTAL